jgi:DNA-binding response OmpR family regulator
MSGSNKELSGCRVLIVEDEYFLANDLEAALKSSGASVIGPIGDFDDAMHQAANDGFDIAIIDINLHNEMAYPIADELIRQRIPFVFCTGYDPVVIPHRFAGVKLWQKPFEASEIVEEIERLYRTRPPRDHTKGRLNRP